MAKSQKEKETVKKKKAVAQRKKTVAGRKKSVPGGTTAAGIIATLQQADIDADQNEYKLASLRQIPLNSAEADSE